MSRILIVEDEEKIARFVELDPEYQDHVLRRHRYRM